MLGPLLATVYSPSLNPIGWSSIGTLVVGSIIAWLASPYFTPTIRRRADFWGLVLLLVMLPFVFMPMLDRFSKTHDSAAFIVLLAFCFAMGLSNLRRLEVEHRLLGHFAALISGLLILVIFSEFGRIVLFYYVLNEKRQLPDWLVWAFPLLFVIAWVALVGIAEPRATRRRRSAAGLCTRCRYDLRGSDSPTCPECDTPRTSAT